MKYVIGLFDDHRDATNAVQDLHQAGFAREDISVMANNAQGQYQVDEKQHRDTGGSEAAEGAGFGATGGAVVGGLVALLLAPAILVLPAIGPVLIGGTLAGTLGGTALGAGLGAAAGALVGALVGAGIPEDDAHVYAEGVRRGGSFIMTPVAGEREADKATSIFRRHNVVDIDRRMDEYRRGGWQRFDDNVETYSATTSPARERELGQTVVGDHTSDRRHIDRDRTL